MSDFKEQEPLISIEYLFMSYDLFGNKKNPDDILEEINERQKAQVREQQLAAERAAKRAAYDRLSPREKNFYHEPSAKFFETLIRLYQQDEYSLKESINRAYQDWVFDEFEPATPREHRIALERKQIATEYRNEFLLADAAQTYKKIVQSHRKNGLMKNEAYAAASEEAAVSGDEFLEKFKERHQLAEELMTSSMGHFYVMKICDALGISFSERLTLYKEHRFIRFTGLAAMGLFLAVLVPIWVLYEEVYEEIPGNEFKEKWASISGEGTYNYSFPENGKGKYVGENDYGYRNGWGSYFWHNGDRFVGQWDRGKLRQGTYTYADGQIYVGEFQDESKNYYSIWGKDLKLFYRHGKGEMNYSNGAKYSGQWNEDAEHGLGTLTFSDGSKYIGQFQGGVPHGEGTFHDAKGNTVVAQFKNGKRQ